MRFVLIILSICFSLPVKVTQSAEFKVESRVDAVTVFPRGAEVARVANVQLAQGAHVIILSDLPAEADLNSIRVEGKATGVLEVGAVDTRRIQVLHQDSEAQKSLRRQIENDIERESDHLDALKAEIEVMATQKRYIENLAALPTTGASYSGSSQARPKEDWVQLLALIGISLTNVNKSMLEHRIEMREVNRRIQDLRKKLAALAPRQVQRSEAKVNVIAREDLTADLVVRYQVSDARWQPFYDARLETGSRNVPSKLVLTRRASIVQRTGEKWQNATLALSTARPSGRSGAPELHPVTVDFLDPPQPAAAPPNMEMEKSIASDAVTLGNTRTMRAKVPARRPAALRESEIEADIGGYQALFKVPGRVTINNTGEARRVKIETISLEPSLLVRSVPKFDARGYLYARMTLPKGVAPILPGQAMLFRDKTFVGKGNMPQLAGGEQHELGFGVDDAIRVKYTKIAEYRGESGIISSSRTDQRKFKISIKNLHERPIAYSILDQRPESLNEDIKVELAGLTKPTEQNFEDRRGVVAWQGKLAPDQEYEIDFGYIVTWPADKKIRYGR